MLTLNTSRLLDMDKVLGRHGWETQVYICINVGIYILSFPFYLVLFVA